MLLSPGCSHKQRLNGCVSVNITLARSLWLLAIMLLSSVVYAEDATVSRLLEEGATFLLKKDSDAALNSFSQILILEPDHPEAHYRLSQVFMLKKDINKAIEYLERATRLDPVNVRYSLNLGTIYEQTGNTEKALQEYQRLVDTGTLDKRVKEAEKRLSLSSGQNLARKGEYNAALLVFNGLLLDYPDDPQVLANIGATYVFLNRAQEAETTFTKLLAVDSNNVIAHINLANIFERTNRPELALGHLKTLIDMNPTPDVTKTARVRYGIIFGRELLRRKDWAGATKAYQEVINIDPTRTEAFFNIALANMNLGNYEQAEKGFLSVLKVAPDDFSARLNLGGLYYDRNQVEKSMEQFQYVIDKDTSGKYKQQAAARMNLIHTLAADKALQEGQVEESLREYQKALDYYSGNVKASFNRGLILIRQRDFEGARVEFESVVRFDPKNLRARLNLANIYEQVRQMTKAAEQYEIIMQIDIKSPEAQQASAKWRITKARGLWADQKLGEAERMFEEVLVEQPDNLEALGFLGIIQQSRGKIEEAAGAFQRVLSLRPNNQRVRLMLGKIYEQLGLDSLAANEFQSILFNGADENVMAEAKARLAAVEDRTNGFSNTVNYSASFDSNIALNAELPTTEWNTSLALSVIYGHKLLDDLTYRIIWSPTHTIYHKSQIDYLSSNVSGNIIKGRPDLNWTIDFGRQDQQSVVTNSVVSRSTSLGVTQAKKLQMPAVLDLAPIGFEGETIPTQLSISTNYRGITSQGSGSDSASGGLGFNMSQGLLGGVSASAGYQFSVFRNLENILQKDSTPRTVRDSVTGLETNATSGVIVYNSRDYEYNSHSLNLSLSKILAPGVRGVISTSGSYTGYVNIDSGSAVRGEDKRRGTVTGNLSASLAYSFFKDMNYFVRASYARSLSNMQGGVSVGSQAEDVQDAVASFQSESLGGYTRWSINTGMLMNF